LDEKQRFCFAWKAVLHFEILRGAMPQESLEDFIRWPFIAEPAHAQTAP
jgi:hypothetical protein